MNKIILFVILLLNSIDLKAQSSLQQITVGGGAGAATAYTGTQTQKTTFAWFGDIAYYPCQFWNINIEGQAGSLAGSTLNSKSLKSFNNNFQAAILNTEFQFGELFDYRQSGFANTIKNLYIGTGYGILDNNVTNVDLKPPHGTGHIKNAMSLVPFKLGYEINLLNTYGEAVLKIDLSISTNYTIGRGLDGYYDSYAKGNYFYNYYAIGFKYAISLKNRSGRKYYKLD